MQYDGVKLDARPLELPDLDVERDSVDAFMVDLVKASNELKWTLCTCASLVPQLDLDQAKLAVLIGLMVRLYKLYDSYVYLICDHRTEVALILARSACDTAIDLTFLCKKKGDKDEFTKFVKASLATDKKIYDEVALDKKNKTGHPFIQSRIQDSVMETFRAADLKLKDVRHSDWRIFGTTADRANSTGLERIYLFIYKNLSRLTHGGWSELIKYHLKSSRGLWYPHHEYNVPRPQSLDGISIMVIDAATEYVNTVAPGFEMSGRLEATRKWFFAMAQRHEQFMSEQANNP